MRILLQDYMFRYGLSVRQVAIATGLPRSTVSDICNGVSPRMDTMEILAQGLHCRITDLFDSPYICTVEQCRCFKKYPRSRTITRMQPIFL